MQHEPLGQRPLCDGEFLSSLETKRVNRRVYSTRDQARADVFDYDERFFIRRRQHSTLGYMNPVEFEEAAKSA